MCTILSHIIRQENARHFSCIATFIHSGNRKLPNSKALKSFKHSQDLEPRKGLFQTQLQMKEPDITRKIKALKIKIKYPKTVCAKFSSSVVALLYYDRFRLFMAAVLIMLM